MRVYNRDLVGQTFNDLFVESLAEPIVRPSGQKKRAWNCVCACGKRVVVTQNALVSGTTKSCGCRSAKAGVLRRSNLINKRFGKLIVVELDHVHTTPSGQRKLFWKCMCDCGNQCVASSGSLKNGYVQSCGCLRSEAISDRTRKDLSGQQFGLLTAVKDTGKSTRSRSAIWLCQCICGNYKEVSASQLISGKTTSCGCIGSSAGENAIKRILDMVCKHSDFRYQKEYEFDNLIGPGGGLLRFDFAIKDKDNQLLGLIEFNGEQHYKEKPGGFGDLQRKITDKMKSDYCLKHQIPLYVIAYDESIINKVQYILKSLTHNANSVPSSDSSEKV